MRVFDLSLRVTITCVLGTLAGYGLDRWLGWLEHFPACTLVGFFVGLGLGMLALVRGLEAVNDGVSGASKRSTRRKAADRADGGTDRANGGDRVNGGKHD